MSTSAHHIGNVLDPDCSARDVLDLVGSKWVMLIVPILSKGALRHSQLLKAIPGISRKVLAQSLRNLERSGLVRRIERPSVRRHVEYSLTPLGISLHCVLEPLDRWAEENFHAVDAASEKYDARHGSAAHQPA